MCICTSICTYVHTYVRVGVYDVPLEVAVS